MRSIIFFVFGYFLGVGSYAQPREITFSQLEKQLKQEPKPTVVFMYTDWCSYCLLMEKKTFSDQSISEKLDSDFYFISFNAESKQEIHFKNHLFAYKKTGIESGVHELALTLGEGNTYPAVIFLNQDQEVVYQHFGYLRPKQIYKLLNAITE